MSWQIQISKNATVNDTVNLIRQTINKYADSPTVINLTNKLKAESKTKEDFLKNLFSYACKNVDYLRDEPGHEKIYTPEKLLREKLGDCKKYSTLLGAVLKRAGFNPLLKIVSYDNKTWAHIYPIINVSGKRKYIVLDCVNNKEYDSEVVYKKGWLHSLKGENMELSLLGRPNIKPMFSNLRKNPDFYKLCARQMLLHRRHILQKGKPVSIYGASADLLNDLSEITGEPVSELLSGADCNQCNNLAGLSATQEIEYRQLMNLGESSVSNVELLNGFLYGTDEIGKKKTGARKKRKSKIWQFLKKVGLAPSRIAFLGVIRINLFGLAKKLYLSWKKDKGARLSKFWKRFGGNPKKLLKTIKAGVKRLIKKGKLKEANLKGLGVAPLVAIFAAAVPVITAIIPLLKKQGVVSKENPADQELVQKVDKAETNLEKRIDSGEADKFVKQVHTDSRLTPQGGGGGGSSNTQEPTQEPTQEQAQEPTQEQAQEPNLEGLAGLGAFDWGTLFKSVKEVFKKPTVKNAFKSIFTIKNIIPKIKNPKTRGYLNQVLSKGEYLLKVVQNPQTPPEEKAQAGQGLKNLIAQVKNEIQKSPGLMKKAGFLGGGFLVNFLKLGVGIGYLQTFYGKQILHFINYIF